MIDLVPKRNKSRYSKVRLKNRRDQQHDRTANERFADMLAFTLRGRPIPYVIVPRATVIYEGRAGSGVLFCASCRMFWVPYRELILWHVPSGFLALSRRYFEKHLACLLGNGGVA